MKIKRILSSGAVLLFFTFLLLPRLSLAEGEPVIFSASPDTISQGDLVTLTGENFGSVNDGYVITPNGEIQSTSNWIDTSIDVYTNIYEESQFALIVRTVESGVYVYSNEISLYPAQEAPIITSISPSIIELQGTTVTFTGENFGDSQSAYDGWLVDGHHVPATFQILSWSDTQITAVVNLADRDWSEYSSAWSTFQVKVKCVDEVCKNYGSGIGDGDWKGPSDEYWSNSVGVSVNVEVCTENEWTCGDWSECSTSGSQSRTCTQTFFCGNAESSEPPATTQSCTYEEVFTDTLPSISSISPQTITPGNTITITGSDFGSSRGSSKLVNGSGSSLSGTILSWTDSQITYITSTYYDTSSKKIGVKKCESYTNCADSVYGSYIYIQPSISSLSTYTGAVGDTVRIYGKYLKSSNITSDSDEYYYIGVYFNGTGADIINWENTYIDVSVPDGATDGVISIKLTADGVSTALTASSPPFDVLEMLSDDPYSAYQDYFKQISIPQAWGLVQDRREIIVAVIDDGVYTNHPEFSDKLWQNTDEIIGNGIDDDNNGYIDDRYGWDFAYDTPEMSSTGSHGTQVAGIIGASTNNGVGIAGVNWNVEIMPLIVFSYEKEIGTSSDIVNRAIYYAVDNGAEVINLSFGSDTVSGYSPGYDAGIKYAYEHNVLVVAAAGNGDKLGYGYDLNSVPQSPVCNDGNENRVIGVGAVSSSNYVTPWSNHGSNCVDIYAPGEDIYTTTMPNSSKVAFYEYVDGTSFSAPIVTGIVSLLKAACPTITSQEVINLLISNADGGVVNAYKTLKDELTCVHQEASSNSSSSTSSDSSSSSQSDGLTSSTFQSRDSVLSREISLLSSVDTSLTTRLIGKILLQVESRGEAWYVNPLDSKKYYMGRPWDAFQLMRSLGLGITDADLALIPTNEDEWEGDDELIKRLSGRILLQVESRGQAWYINPDDGKRYYMGLPSDAFSLMRSLGLGITDDDLRKIDVESI